MSTIIKLRCVDQVLAFETTPVIASGGQQEDFIQVSFCSKWDGLIKTAVFWRNEDDAYHVPLDDTGSCVIPPEVLTDEGSIYFGVFGVSAAGKQRTSEVLRYVVAKGAITSGTKPSDPTPDLYTSVMAMAQQMVEAAEDMRQTMDRYDPPERGKDYWTPEDKAEIIEEVTNELTDKVMDGVADQVAEKITGDIKDQVENDLIQNGAGYVVQNVWLVTPCTPASSEAVLGESTRVMVLSSDGATIGGATAILTRAASVNVVEGGSVTLVDGETISVESTNVTDLLCGYFWYWDAVPSSVFYTPLEGGTYTEESGGSIELFIDAQRVTGVYHAEKTGVTDVLYGEPGAYPASGYAETPDAAPYKGYKYRGLGKFKNIPLYVGSGGGGGGGAGVPGEDGATFVPFVSPDGVISWSNDQGRDNPDPVDLVAAVLAALPNGDDAEYPESGEDEAPYGYCHVCGEVLSYYEDGDYSALNCPNCGGL